MVTVIFASEGAADQGTDAVPCDVLPSFGDQTADAADHNGDGTEVGKTAQGIGRDSKRPG